MQKTQYKKAKYWNTMMVNQKGQKNWSDIANVCKCLHYEKVYMKQIRKNDWWGWKIDLHKSVNDYPNASYIVNEAKYI